MTVRRYHMRANTVIRAGAGTGKTFTLVETVTHLLAGLTHHREPLHPSHVVAITFTEKAAGEMLARIRDRIGRLADVESTADDPLRQSAHILEIPLPGADFWRGVRREIDQLRVSTFHGFCLALLQQYPLEAGLEPAFGIYDEAGLADRLEVLAELEVLSALEDPDRASPVEGLLERVRLRRLGDFGNGLADLLPGLLATIHEAGLEVSDLPLLQPSPRGELADEEARLAAAVIDLLDRLDRRFAREKRRLGRIDFSDMQRLARNLMRDREDLRAAIKSRIRTLLVDEFQDTNPIQRDLVLLLSEPPNLAVDWTVRSAPGAIPDAYRLGQRRLFVVGDAKQSIYDFRGADVTSFRIVEQRVAEQQGVVDSLRVSYRSRPALVTAQNALFAQALAGRADERDPWFVHWSDDAVLNANRAPMDGGRAIHLLDSQAICRQRAEESGRALKLDPSDELAAVAELLAEIVRGSNPWRVQDSAAARLGDHAAKRPARWGDITILLRRFVRVLPLLTEQLDARGVPYFVVKGTGFFAAREVADLSVALRAVCASADAPALAAWLRGPMIGVSDEALARLAVRHGRVGQRVMRRIADGSEPLEHFGPDDQRALRIAAKLLDVLARRGERIGPASVIDELLARTDWPAVLAALPRGAQALGNIERVRLLATEDAQSTGGSLAGFSRRLAELVEREPPAEAAQVVEADDDVVRIMTIHQAKGLECPIAIVPDGDPGRPPHPPKLLFSPRQGIGVGRPRHRREDPPVWSACRDEALSRRLAEQRRLMYVAVTRARDHVVLSGSAPLAKVGSATNGEPRRFELQPPPTNGADWMHQVYALAKEAPDWLGAIPADVLLNRDSVAVPRSTAPPPPDLGARIAGLQASAELPGGELVAAVTQLGDYAICPRRYWLAWERGLGAGPRLGEASDGPVRPTAERGEDVPSWPAQPMDRGTLAHLLLERIDAPRYRGSSPATRRDILSALAGAVDTDLDHESLDEVLARVDAALCGDVGQLLLRPGLMRERPFVIHVPIAGRPDSGLVLRGQIDVVVPDDLAAPTLIVDYKYSEPGPLGFYAFQLKCYALAHHRRLGSPPAGIYRAGIVFLRDPEPRLRTLDEALTAEALEAFAAELGELSERLLKSRQANQWPYLGTAEKDRTCRRTHCRFREFCFP